MTRFLLPLAIWLPRGKGSGMAGYAVVDVETTGLFWARGDRIAEIAIVHVALSGDIESTWSTLINPQRHLGAQHIHGISNADAGLAPAFPEVAGTIAALLRGRVFAAHNAVFDRGFMRSEFDRAGIPVPLGPDTSLCTMRLAGRFLGCRQKTLAACCAAAGIDIAGAHSALGDAMATARLLAAYIGMADPVPWTRVIESAAQATWPAIDTPPAVPVTRGAAADAANRGEL